MDLGILSPFILGIAISLTPGKGNTANEQDAYKSLAKAIYKECDIDDMVKRLEDKYLDEDVKKYGTILINVGKIAVEKKITYEWTF